MKKNTVIRKTVIIITFIFMAAYYLKINPMYLFDTDDWLTTLPARDILPIWGGWNPTRALPEVLHPILTYFAYVFIQPFTGNIVMASSYVYGVFTAILVVAFIKCLSDFACNKENKYWIISFILLFSVLIVLFDNGKENTIFVFASWNVTCVFYYLIPNLLNMMLVLFMIRLNETEDQQVSLNGWKMGALIAYIYMCVNSNLYANVLPVIYAFTCVDKFLYLKIKNRKNDSLPRSLYIDFFIMLLWGVTLIFEYSGGRANQIGNNEWLSAVPNAIKNAINILNNINLYIKWIFILILLYGIFIAIRNKNKEWKLYIELVAMELFAIIYYVLLDSKTGIHTNEGSNSLSLLFFLIIAFAYSLKLIIRNEKQSNYLTIVTPFLICLLLSVFAKDFRNIRPMNIYGINSRTCLNIVNDMFDQMQENSIEKDSDTVEIHVPSFHSEDNFPLAEYGADRFARAYYVYSDAPYYKNVSFVVDENKNKEFGID